MDKSTSTATGISMNILGASFFLVTAMNTTFIGERKNVTEDNEDDPMKYLDAHELDFNMALMSGSVNFKEDPYMLAGVRMLMLKNVCMRSVVTVHPGGRIGNAFMEWATALGVAQRLNAALPHDQRRVVALANVTLGNLSQVFDGVRAVTIGSVIQRRKVKSWGSFIPCTEVYPNPEIVFKIYMNQWHKVYYTPRRVANNVPVILNVDSGFAPAVSSSVMKLRAHLRFKDRFLVPAASRLRSLAEQVRSEAETGHDSQVILVGMHARRTDMTYIIEEVYEGFAADARYFAHALRWMLWTLRTRNSSSQFFRPKYLPLKADSIENAISRLSPVYVTPPSLKKLPASPLVAVAVISDDMLWVNQTLLPVLRKFLAIRKVKGVQVFAAGSEDPTVDLALLSQCNHTIISYGTYGVLGAILSWGRTVVYKMDHHRNFAATLAKFFPHWVIMK